MVRARSAGLCPCAESHHISPTFNAHQLRPPSLDMTTRSAHPISITYDEPSSVENHFHRVRRSRSGLCRPHRERAQQSRSTCLPRLGEPTGSENLSYVHELAVTIPHEPQAFTIEPSYAVPTVFHPLPVPQSLQNEKVDGTLSQVF